MDASFSADVMKPSVSAAAVHAESDGVELRLRDGREVRALGKILTEQAVGVLVRAALPGTLRIAELEPWSLALGRG